MRLSWIAPLALIGGAVVGLAGIVIGATGGEVGFGGSSGSDLLATLAVVLLGVGAGGLSVAPARPLWRFARAVLALDAIGLIGLGISSSANTGPDTSPLVLVLIAALAILLVGLPMTGAVFLLRPGATRLIGILFVVGSAGAVIEIASGSRVALALLAGIPFGFAALGALALGLVP